jgi:hypothetical protein
MLEKVLKLKKDTVSQTVFLDEAMKVRATRVFNDVYRSDAFFY